MGYVMSDPVVSHAGVADPHYIGPLERDITERIASGEACAHFIGGFKAGVLLSQGLRRYQSWL